jgi:hypothetical protein
MHVKIEAIRGYTKVELVATVDKAGEAADMADQLDLWAQGSAEDHRGEDETPVTKPEGDGWEILDAGVERKVRKAYARDKAVVVTAGSRCSLYSEVVVDGRADLVIDRLGDLVVTTSDRLFVRA